MSEIVGPLTLFWLWVISCDHLVPAYCHLMEGFLGNYMYVVTEFFLEGMNWQAGWPKARTVQFCLAICVILCGMMKTLPEEGANATLPWTHQTPRFLYIFSRCPFPRTSLASNLICTHTQLSPTLNTTWMQEVLAQHSSSSYSPLFAHPLFRGPFG